MRTTKSTQRSIREYPRVRNCGMASPPSFDQLDGNQSTVNDSFSDLLFSHFSETYCIRFLLQRPPADTHEHCVPAKSKKKIN